MSNKFLKSGGHYPVVNTEWRFAIALVFAGVLFSSLDPLYFQIFRFPPQYYRPIQMAIAIFIAACAGFMAISAITQYGPHRQFFRFEKYLFLILILSPVWAIIGYINAWPMNYIIGDLYRISIFPVLYLILTRNPLLSAERVWSFFYASLLVGGIYSACIAMKANFLDESHFKISAAGMVPPLFYMSIKRRLSFWEIPLFMFLIIGGVVTTKRGVWLSLCFLPLVGVIANASLKRFVGVCFRFGILFFLLVIIFEHLHYSGNSYHLEKLIQNRWQETLGDFSSGGDFDPESGGRMGEVVGVVDTFNQRHSPMDWISGMGLGALVAARNGRVRHHVHSTPAVFLARTGLIGLMLWLLFMTEFVIHLSKSLKHVDCSTEKRDILVFLVMTICLSFIMMIKSQGFWGDAPSAILFAFAVQISFERAARQRILVTRSISGTGHFKSVSGPVMMHL